MAVRGQLAGEDEPDAAGGTGDEGGGSGHASPYAEGTSSPNLDLVIDCADPEALADFWAAALGYRKVGFAEPYFLLLPQDRTQPPLLLQRVPEAKASKNRVHLDLRTEDVEAEVKRIEELGARRLYAGHHGETGWVTMADPEGNEFCVCPGVPLELGLG
ncbi:MAG TPA: VOC family protein [Acidimicrobiales bacterium]|nr:VOC family protein [Acidimicrobiales bacterium]